MARIFLVDTMLHIYRAFFALPPLHTRSGIPTNAVAGFLATLQHIWTSQQVTHMALCMDPAGPGDGGYRKGIDPTYRAHRKDRPSQLQCQVPLIEKVTTQLGIPCFRQNPYEADDVIATLTHMSVLEGNEVVIVSNDKDLTQLCALPGVSLLRLKGQGAKIVPEIVTGADVERIFGVPPGLIPSWLALNGDTADNIKGIPGIGPKTACKLLEGGCVPFLLDHLDGVPEKWRRVLEENRDHLLMNLQLATLRTDIWPAVCGEVDPPMTYETTPYPFGDLSICYELELNRLIRSLEGGLFAPKSISELWATVEQEWPPK